MTDNFAVYDAATYKPIRRRLTEAAALAVAQEFGEGNVIIARECARPELGSPGRFVE